MRECANEINGFKVNEPNVQHSHIGTLTTLAYYLFKVDAQAQASQLVQQYVQ